MRERASLALSLFAERKAEHARLSARNRDAKPIVGGSKIISRLGLSAWSPRP